MNEVRGSKQGSFFLKVVAYYKCPPDEIELLKQLVKEDLESARACFAALAQEIDEIENQFVPLDA